MSAPELERTPATGVLVAEAQGIGGWWLPRRGKWPAKREWCSGPSQTQAHKHSHLILTLFTAIPIQAEIAPNSKHAQSSLISYFYEFVHFIKLLELEM